MTNEEQLVETLMFRLERATDLARNGDAHPKGHDTHVLEEGTSHCICGYDLRSVASANARSIEKIRKHMYTEGYRDALQDLLSLLDPTGLPRSD